MSKLEVKLDLSAIERLSTSLESVDKDAVGKTALRVVNQVVEDAYETVRPRMIRNINLTDTYIQSRMSVNSAKSTNDVKASIVASGSKPDMTILARYGARMLSKPVKNPERSKGDQLFSRNIAPTFKAAGISVEVTRGSREVFSHGFFMPLRNANTVGLFTRKGNEKVKHRYGPSVYQLFAHYAKDLSTELTDELEQKLTDEVGKLIDKALA